MRPPETVGLHVDPEIGVVLVVSYWTHVDFDNENLTLLYDNDNDGFFDARREIEVLSE
ncbi:MAG: hypothetical protein ACYS26_11410 [Planctomycetota bacterium]